MSKLKKGEVEKVEIARGAWKLEKWLGKAQTEQKTAQQIAEAEYKKLHPDRYFVAFVKLDTPRCSLPERLWPSHIHETFLFEQEDMPSMDDVIATAKKAWQMGERVEVLNFYELSAEDYAAFIGDESEWKVIEEATT